MAGSVEEREKETLIQLLKYVESIADKKGEMQSHDLQQYAKEGGMVVTKEELSSIVEGLEDGYKHCVQFDLEQEGPVWLKFERMPKSSPPDIPRILSDVVTVGPSSKPEHAPQLAAESDVPLSKQQEEAFEEYYAQWKAWSAYEETRAIYTALFGLYHELQNEGMEKPVEVVWGIGHVVWKYKGVALNHPVIELLVEIDINTHNGAILVRPREQVLPELALGRFSDALPDLNTSVERVHNHTRSMMLPGSISPFMVDTYMPILRATSVHLSDSGQVLSGPPGEPTEQLCIYTSWAIYSRARCTNFFVQDIRQLMVELRKANSVIPPAALRLVREPSHLVNAANSLDDDDALNDFYFPRPSNAAQVDIIRRLETSDAVIVEGPPGTGKTHTIANIICHFLATGRRVLVTSKGEPAVEVLRGQIPEGVRELTISLTTSEREGLKQLEQVIEHIANKISQGNPAKIDREIKSVESMVREIKQQLHDFDKEIEELALKQLRPHTLDLGPELTALNPAKLAEKLSKPENKLSRFIPDQLDSKFDEDPLFDESDIQEIRSIRMEVGTALLYSGVDLPELRFFPATSEVSRLYQAVTDATRAISQSEDLAIELEDKANEEVMQRVAQIALDDKPSMQTAATVIVEGLAKCVGALHQIENARADWFLVHCRAWRQNGSRKLIDLTKMAKDISKSREDFMLRPVRLPSHRAIVEYCQTYYGNKADEPYAPLLESVGALAQGKSTTSLFSSLMASIPLVGNSERTKQQQMEALLGEITVLNRPPRSPEDWEWVRQNLVFRDTVTRFVEQWNLLVEARQEIGSPDHRAARMDCQHLNDDGTVDVDRAAIWVSDTCLSILQAASTVDAAVFAVRGALIELQLDENLVLGSAATARMLRQKLSSKLNLSYVEPARQKLQQLANDLRVSVRGKAPVVERMSSLLNQVAQSGEIPNLNSKEQMERLWELLLGEVANAHNMKDRVARLKELTQAIRQSGAPKWAELLETQPVLPAASTSSLEDLADKLLGLPRSASQRKIEDELTSPNWRKTWNLIRAEAYLRSVDGRKRINYIMSRRRQLTQELERIFLSVVTRRTELHLRTSLSEAAQSALVRFITALSHAGHTNSNSVRASRYQEEARVAMQRCYGAVPCWIMPTWRVSQFIPADLGSFDLVIVDEASQSDIQALPALLRGKKLLIVGDAKQVSPTEAFVSEEKITHLRTMLQNQLYSELMLPGRSLFDLSRAVFPGSRIVLTEHFRCARPIVAYSNARFYAGQLQPLRIPKASERLRPTLVDVYLPDGEKRGKVNYDEANAIVQEVLALSSDPATAHRSIGVISLIGSEQAKLLQGMLLEQLGEEAFMRHKVCCGDPSAFQGNEKDIIFLSMIAAPGQCPGQIGLQWEQRFNVAMTRARDRMYLFRSIKSEQISNPSDLKATIIRHFQSAHLQGENADGVDSMDVLTNEVQKDIFSRLRAKGYRVRCQVVVGGLAIDFVVEGVNDERVAVCIDGKDSSLDLESWRESVKQQHVMERVGWTFWRCWKSSYLLAPDECIDDLVGLLSSLDIGPWPDAPQTTRSGSSVGSASNDEAEVHRSALAFVQGAMGGNEERHVGFASRAARGSPSSVEARASRVVKSSTNAAALKKRYLSAEDAGDEDNGADNGDDDETASKASGRNKRVKAAAERPPPAKGRRGGAAAATAAAESKSTKRKAPARGAAGAKKKASRAQDSDEDDFIAPDSESEEEERPQKATKRGAAAKAAPAGGKRRKAADEYVPSDDSGNDDYEEEESEDEAPARKRKAAPAAPAARAASRPARQAASAAAQKRKEKQAEMSELRDAYGDVIDSDVSSIRSNSDDYEEEDSRASTTQSRARGRSGAARDTGTAKPASPTKRAATAAAKSSPRKQSTQQQPSKQPNLIEALRAELISARYTGSTDDQSMLNALAEAGYDVKRALDTLCPNLNRAPSFHFTGRWNLW